jgi:hypothetical protein
MTREHQPRPFDEQAALEELERLADKIQMSRRQRAQAVAEFDAFVKTFRHDGGASPAASQRVELPASATPAPAPSAVSAYAAPRVTATVASPATAAAQPASGAASEAAAHATAPPVSVAEESRVWSATVEHQAADFERAAANVEGHAAAIERRTIAPAAWSEWKPPVPLTDWRVLAGAAAALVILVLLLWRPWSSPAAPAAAVPASAPASPAAATPTAGQPAPPVTPAAPPRAINLELTTLRPVWMRVVVDDRKEIEREVPGGQKIPFGADRAIVVRAGDAGAIRISVNGKDQGPIGKDGFPATRTFTSQR